MISTGTRLAERYEVVAPLGAGGMGEVYLARDLRLLRDVALKVLPQRLNRDPDARARFEREARTLASLSHPNILAIHDFGAEGEVRFAVTEMLHGETLRLCLARAPLAWPRALATALEIAHGLAAAHSRGVIHRDLKPENLFLTDAGDVKILDFGLAQREDPRAAPEDVSTARTDPGILMGTVAYMAPEQLRGRAADARSDIFSLGCVLFEMLTATKPWARATPADTMAAILNEDAPSLGDRSMPPALLQALGRALEKDPARRFQSCQDLAFALEMVATVSDQRPLPIAPRPRFDRRLAWVAGALGLVVLIGFGLFQALPIHGPRVGSIAVLPLANAGADPDLEYLGEGIAESVINELAQIPQLKVLARSTTFRYRGRQGEPVEVGRELKVDAVLTGRVVPRGDLVSLEAELVDVAHGSQLWGEHYSVPLAGVMRVQEEIAREIAQRLAVKLTGEQRERLGRRQTTDGEAYRLYLKGRYQWNKRTAEGFRKAIELFQEALERDPEYALAYAGLADAHALMGAYSVVPPAAAFTRATAAAGEALKRDDGLAEAHACLALCKFLYDWKWSEAEAQFKRAIVVKPGYATGHHWYGEFLIAQGRTSEALAALTRAEELDPLSLIIPTDIGRAHFFGRHYAAAEQQCRRPLDVDPGFVQALLCIGMADTELQRFSDARVRFESALAASGDPRDASSLAYLEARAGQRDRARQLLGELGEIGRSRYVAPYVLALVDAALGQRDEAFGLLEQAFAERSEWIAYLRVDPRLDGLRTDPRFTDLLRRAGLETPPSSSPAR